MAFGSSYGVIGGALGYSLPAIQFFGTLGPTGGISGPLIGGIGGIGFGGYRGGWEPVGGWDAIAKAVAAGVLSSVGYGDYEQGVFDRPVPRVPPIRPPEVVVRKPALPTPPIGAVPVSTSTEAEVAIDWGGLIGDLGSQYIAAQYAPTPQFNSFVSGGGLPAPVPQGSVTAEGVNWGGGGGGGTIVPTNAECGSGPCGSPRYLTYDCRTNTFSKKRRRRRGRLLTASDQHDLGVIVAMFGKGAAGQIALAAAVKR